MRAVQFCRSVFKRLLLLDVLTAHDVIIDIFVTQLFLIDDRQHRDCVGDGGPCCVVGDIRPLKSADCYLWVDNIAVRKSRGVSFP